MYIYIPQVFQLLQSQPAIVIVTVTDATDARKVERENAAQSQNILDCEMFHAIKFAARAQMIRAAVAEVCHLRALFQVCEAAAPQTFQIDKM
jgi:hypothetical protein